MQTTLRILLGDQLNIQHSWFGQVRPDVVYLLMEVRSETDYVKHHLAKVVGIFAAMRRFAQVLTEAGHTVVYLTLDNPENRQALDANILAWVGKGEFDRVEYQLPDEYRVDVTMQQLAQTMHPIPCVGVDSEHFLAERNALQKVFKGRKQYLLETFYRHMRRRYSILMEGDEPVMGKWNFDEENRKKLPEHEPVPQPPSFAHDLTSLVELIQSCGVETIGTLKGGLFPYPIDRAEALQWLQYFVHTLLPRFGTYEDAMDSRYRVLFHSRLSFAMNIKLLHPLEVIHAAVKAYEQQQESISIAQVEGFVRQILGWREYMRGVYWAHMPEYATLNYFQHRSPLPAFYWTGETRMNCLRNAITQSLEDAYAHHIQRLMLTGSFALLAGVHPDEVDAWYLGIYIDAFEWVEITNTRGMSQYADGGIVGSKPYVSGAAYIQRMSNYCKGCFYDPTKRVGERACPFNSLYWEFHHRHRSLLERNPRIGMVYRTWDRMHDTDRKATIERAQFLRENLDNL
jgi:deoxyribodipyrimidine photolyase-related protein